MSRLLAGWRILAIAAMLILTIAGLSSAVLAKQSAGWILQQTSDYAGNEVTYISPEGIKMVAKGLTTIILSPSQKVILFNEQNKSYYESNYQMWKAQFIRKSSDLAGRSITRGRAGVIAGVPVTQYLFSNMDNGQRRVTEEYWSVADNSIPAAVIEAMTHIADLPQNVGVPLRIDVIKADGTRLTGLNTTQCRRAWIPSSTFDGPEGYTRVNDPMTLLLGAGKPAP